MIKFFTAGESHGKSLSAMIEGFPSNLKINFENINKELKRRQGGYGRGGRMKIESDEIEVLSGIRFGKTLGTPISLLIRNYDWENWSDIMSAEIKRKAEKITIPRPGHADLVGVSKYNYNDIRNSIERSSARETAARVAVGALAKELLSRFGINFTSFVESIGGIYPAEPYYDKLLKKGKISSREFEEIDVISNKSSVGVLSAAQEDKIIKRIKKAKKEGDSLGGTCVIIASNLPVGLGSFVHYERRLDTLISKNVMSINALKAIEFGKGFAIADLAGSKVHDEIINEDENYTRATNFAGGMEGGISNGMPVVIRVAMKPIATLMKPLKSIDLRTGEPVEARRERSDTVAVPACRVVAESMLAWSIAEAFVEKFGGDSFEEMKDNFNNYTKKLQTRLKRNFK
jgi:chorismate synthase